MSPLRFECEMRCTRKREFCATNRAWATWLSRIQSKLLLILSRGASEGLRRSGDCTVWTTPGERYQQDEAENFLDAGGDGSRHISSWSPNRRECHCPAPPLQSTLPRCRLFRNVMTCQGLQLPASGFPGSTRSQPTERIGPMRKFLGKLGGGNSMATPPRHHAFIAVFSSRLPRYRPLHKPAGNANHHIHNS